MSNVWFIGDIHGGHRNVQYNLFYYKKEDWYLSPNNYIDIENFVDGAWYTYKELKGNNNGRTHQAK